MKKLKQLKNRTLWSIVFFVIANILSYVALLEVSQNITFNTHIYDVYYNTLGVIVTLMGNTVSFNLALLFFLGSALMNYKLFPQLVIAKLLVYIVWLCLYHADLNFLPGMSSIYASGWMEFTQRQIATFMAMCVAVIFFLAGWLSNLIYEKKFKKEEVYEYHHPVWWDDYL